MGNTPSKVGEQPFKGSSAQIYNDDGEQVATASTISSKRYEGPTETKQLNNLRETRQHHPLPAVPVLDFDSMPILQPSTSANGSSRKSHRSQASSFGSLQSMQSARADYRGSSPVIKSGICEVKPVVTTQASPSLSYRASVLSGSTSPELHSISRRRLSCRSTVSTRSGPCSRRSSIVSRYDHDDEPLDVGIPPQVPPHRVISGKVVLPPPDDGAVPDDGSISFPSYQSSPTLANARSISPTRSMDTQIYTRKCSFHRTSPYASSSESPVGRSRASSLASARFPGKDPHSELDSDDTSWEDSQAEPSTPESSAAFALDGYGKGTTLRVVNVDSSSIEGSLQAEGERFYVPSKATLAEQQEKVVAWKHRYQRYGHLLPNERPNTQRSLDANRNQNR